MMMIMMMNHHHHHHGHHPTDKPAERQQTDSIIAALRSVRVVPYIKPLLCPILRVCLYTIYTKP